MRLPQGVSEWETVQYPGLRVATAALYTPFAGLAQRLEDGIVTNNEVNRNPNKKLSWSISLKIDCSSLLTLLGGGISFQQSLYIHSPALMKRR